MFCSHCGSPATPGAVRCPSCGQPLAGTGPALGVLTPPVADLPTHVVPFPETVDASTDADRTIESDASPTISARTASGPFASGRAIAGRYHVIRLLGAGGMGAVYQAWDEKLGVAVALKVILQPKDGDPHATEALERRFKRELLLARQVTHKNVVRIHDLGEVDGTMYITMPYVQGANLAAILAREGRLPVGRALQIGKQVASGLVAAHEAGVIHRDLKPANIMIETEDDRALIMDFGIARSSTGQEALATHTGAIVGTLEYMAPEQAEGKPVDQRCDIYALGLILYDLVIGGRHGGTSAVASLMARLRKPLPSLRSVNPDVPDAFETIVDRCLERDPAARYQSATELVAALDALDEQGHLRPVKTTPRLGQVVLIASAAALVAVLAIALVFRGRSGARPAPPPHEPVSVLIADFENRANDPVFDGSIEQALTIGLEGASFITTYPREGARRLATQLAGGKLNNDAARLISVRDGVKFVVGGSIEGGSSGYTISATVIDPAVGKTLKTATARAKTKADVLQAVGTLASAVRRDLGDTTPESAQLAASETFTAASLEAVREYTLAQNLQNNSKDEEAIPHYKRAIEADPNFGRAYSGWAVSTFQLGRNDEAAELWKKALSLMDRMTERERYRTLGTYYLGIARNYDQAIDTFGKLLERYPADRAGHNNLAFAYFYKLNFAKALEEQRKAVDIYKGSFKFRNNYVLYAMYAGDFSTAESGARDLLREDPKFADAYFPLATSLIAKGDRAGARQTYEQMGQTGAAGASRAAMGLADLAMYEGRVADAQQILAAAVVVDERAKNTVGQASKYVALAETHQALGQRQETLEAIRKALEVTKDETVAVPVARILADEGRVADAKALTAGLDKQLQTQSRAYARVIDGEIALQQDRAVDAVDAFRAAQRLLDVWLAHFNLGVAYVRAGHYAEAVAEFETCTKRRGEATAVFLDDVPTFRYLATLPYWMGRAQEGVGMKTPADDNYKAYLALRPDGLKDPLAADARQRLAKR